MKPKDKEYIFENIKKKSLKEIAKELNIKERNIKKFLDRNKDKLPGLGDRPIGMDRTQKPYFQIIGLAIIFVLALIVRLYPVIDNPEKMRAGIGPFGDSHLYHRIAYNLYRGNGFSGTNDGGAYGAAVKKENLVYEPAITRGPIYPFFIYTVYKFLGNPEDMKSKATWHKNWDKIRITQCVLDAMLCVLVFLIVRAIYPASFWPALTAAFLYCFSFYNIFYTRALLSESVNTFLLTSAILFCVLGLKNKKKFWWFLSGVGFGLLVLSRPEYSLFLLAFPLYIFFVDRQIPHAALKAAMIFLISAIVVIAPWTLRNYKVFGKPIIVNAGGTGYLLFCGTFESYKDWRGWGVFPEEIFTDKKDKVKADALYKDFNQYVKEGTIKINECDPHFMELALKRIRNNFSECLTTWISRIPSLWHQNYRELYAYKEASGNFFIFYFVFALCAFWMGDRQERMLMAPICLLFLYLTLIFLPLHTEPRYGVPLMPGIICLTGIGIYKALSRIKT